MTYVLRFFLPALAMLWTSVAGFAAAKFVTVVIPAEDFPRVPAVQRLDISAQCHHVDVGLAATFIPVDINVDPSAVPHPTVTSWFGKSRAHFGSDAPFVRDLFSGRTMFRYYLFCYWRAFELVAWGTSFDDPQLPRHIYATVVFDRKGRLFNYSGLVVHDYDDVRSHLR